MEYIPNILFAILLIAGIGYFTKNVQKLYRNVKLGKDVNRTDNRSERWKNMGPEYKDIIADCAEVMAKKGQC